MDKKISKPYGLHLTVDGYGCPPETLNSMELVFDFLKKCPAEIEMTRIFQPIVLRYDAPTEEDSGITGFVIIAESHISVHTYPHKGFVTLDVYSCKNFAVDKAMNFIKKTFDIKELEINLVKRGMKFHQIKAVQSIKV